MDKLREALSSEMKSAEERLDTMRQVFRLLYGPATHVKRVPSRVAGIVAAIQRRTPSKQPRSHGGGYKKVLSHLSSVTGQFVKSDELIRLAGFGSVGSLHASIYQLRGEGHKIESRKGVGYRLLSSQ